MATRSILIVGGGTAGWLTAAYLARFLAQSDHAPIAITLLEAPEIGTIGVGEATFPTIRATLKFLGLDEAQFVRDTAATFKQGIRFVDWAKPPVAGKPDAYFHPFEAPFYAEEASLVPYWLRQDEGTRAPFAEAVTIQQRVAAAGRAPKRPDEGDYAGPLNYAYHFDAARFAELLAERAKALGVRHLQGALSQVVPDGRGGIDHVVTAAHGRLAADLFVDCTGFRAELIGQALGSPFTDTSETLFTDRALTCKLPYGCADGPLASFTVSTAHEAGWTWDIGLATGRGVGCVYSSRHMSDDRAAAILQAYVGAGTPVTPRRIAFRPGYRERPWIGNCVAVGLSGGFMEPLESTGVVLIEAAVAMIAELLPRHGPVDAPAARFNALMTARYQNIVNFLKLHYCLSQRTEPFWRDNADPATIPERLREMLAQWRYRPPSRFDFLLDVESFAFFNYQYVLYGMGFQTDLGPAGDTLPQAQAAERLFARIRSFGERAAQDLPSHRALVDEINAA